MGVRRLFLTGTVLAAVLALCAWLPAAASATQTARIEVGLTPERLGAATTVSLGLEIKAGERVPVPLSSIELAYPPNLGFATSGLGLASCTPAALEELGSLVCPPNSKMGSGSAAVEISIGPELVKENVQLTLFAGPSLDGYLHVLVYISGVSPVYAQLVLTGVLLPGHLSILVPPIPSLPAAPDIAVVQMRLRVGGHLTYYEQIDGRSVAYHPPGVGLPSRCPRGGFPFAAMFAFSDGSSSSANTSVPCPRQHSTRRTRASRSRTF